jgi:glycosyltransferase involved in cell wall biosynthesis
MESSNEEIEQKMKVSIITPCHNRAKFMDATIASVLNQVGEFSIQYIIQNAGRSPAVRQILDRWENDVANSRFTAGCQGIDLHIHHEADGNMYEGLNRGFARADGEIYAWINSDDLYHQGAFQTVSEIFSENDDVHWLVGIANSFNRRGSRSGYDPMTKAYSSEFIRRGLYRIENANTGFGWIPQDCCFWRRDLWNRADGRLDDSLRFAADFKLWQSFAHHTDLVKVNSFLGGYRYHGDQFTAESANYISELPPLELPPAGFRALHKWLSRNPEDSGLFFNPERGKPWIDGFDLQFEWLAGREATFNFAADRWELNLMPIL